MAIQISQLINQMVKDRQLTQREPWRWSWGNHEQCSALFIYIFRNVDSTFEHYEHLSEYDEIIEWMTDTEDKGLMLAGDCGRGKSVVLNYVLPVLFRMKNRILLPVHAQDICKELPNQQAYYGQRPPTYLDRLLNSPFPAIDELGVEPMMNDYGEKSEGFNMVLNAAERYHRPVFATTNLNDDKMLNRYGERTMDRLTHLCRTVHFQGESLRR